MNLVFSCSLLLPWFSLWYKLEFPYRISLINDTHCQMLNDSCTNFPAQSGDADITVN
jgi:hypothetical protein